MYLYEIIIIGIGLAMDASTVAMTNGMVEVKMRLKKAFSIAVIFGFMQGLMPIFGYYFGKLFSDYIEDISHYIAFVLLLFLGVRMIYEACKGDAITYRVTKSKVIVQGIATSIDALLIGVTFAAMEVEIYSASFIIAIITIILCLLSIYLGRKFGDILKNKAEIFGGAILIIIGFKFLLECFI